MCLFPYWYVMSRWALFHPVGDFNIVAQISLLFIQQPSKRYCDLTKTSLLNRNATYLTIDLIEKHILLLLKHAHIWPDRVTVTHFAVHIVRFICFCLLAKSLDGPSPVFMYFLQKRFFLCESAVEILLIREGVHILCVALDLRSFSRMVVYIRELSRDRSHCRTT